jgi:hypothetical protein
MTASDRPVPAEMQDPPTACRLFVHVRGPRRPASRSLMETRPGRRTWEQDLLTTQDRPAGSATKRSTPLASGTPSRPTSARPPAHRADEFLLSRPDVHAVVVEAEGRVVGSTFLWETGLVAAGGRAERRPSCRAHDCARGSRTARCAARHGRRWMRPTSSAAAFTAMTEPASSARLSGKVSPR